MYIYLSTISVCKIYTGEHLPERAGRRTIKVLIGIYQALPSEEVLVNRLQ